MDRNAIPIHLGLNVGSVAGLGSVVVHFRVYILTQHIGPGIDWTTTQKSF